MKIFFKILAATAAMAGLCLLIYELYRRYEEKDNRCSDGTLKHFINRGLKKKADDGDTIADYRYDDDDDLFDDDFFADLDGVSHAVEVEIEDTAEELTDAVSEAVEDISEAAEDVADAVEDAVEDNFGLSEEELEQLLDN